MRRETNPWLDSHNHAALVPIPRSKPTHSLQAYITGPARATPDQPVLVWITGAGSSAAVHLALQRHLSENFHIRCLFYDRAGYDRSTRDPSPDRQRILASHTAQDLRDLLEAIDVPPPWIVVAHSYGGIIAREFLQLTIERGEDAGIAGLLLFDCATEMMLQMYPRIPSKELEIMAEGVDFEALTHLIPETGLTDEELEYAVEAQARTAAGGARHEDTHGSGRLLAGHLQMDRHLMAHGYLAVVGTNMAADYKLLYDEGLKLGNGTEGERWRARDFVETARLFQKQIGRAQLELVREEGRRRFTFLKGVGHDAPLRIKRGDYVGEQVRWILHQMKMESTR